MFPKLRSLWQTIWNRSRFERDLDDEMRFHLEARMEDVARYAFARGKPPRAQIELAAPSHRSGRRNTPSELVR